MSAPTKNAWADRLAQATLALNWVGGLSLVAIMCILAAGVIMRKLVGQPILGVNEIVQLTAVALVMSALPHCTAQNGHVGVDVFDPMLGKWGRFVGDLLSRILSGGVLAVLCQRAWLKAMDALEWGDATNMLGLPIWPFYLILSIGTGLCVLVLMAQLILLFAGESDA